MGPRIWLALAILATRATEAATPAAGLPGWAVVNGDVARGAARSAELYCGVCHGTAGNSTTPEWPSLAGQLPGYIAEQLAMFRAKRRVSAEMEPMAASLTDSDLADLASYFSAQPPPPATTPVGPVDELGRRLYRDGAPSRGIAACGSCHGMDGRGDSSLRAPALRSQQSTYLAKQLQAYQLRSRYPLDAPPAAVSMSEAVARLTPEELAAVSGWLQHPD